MFNGLSVLLCLIVSVFLLLWMQTGRGNRLHHDMVFTAMAMAFLLIGMSSLLAVRLALFSIPFVSIVTVIAATLLALTKVIPNTEEPAVYSPSNPFLFSFIVVLALFCCVLYALFPTYYMLGGRDPGLYLLFSHHINQTGGLNLDLPWLRELHEKYGDAIYLGYPGIYSAFDLGISDDPAALIPQFMHLFPSYGAIGAALAGIEGIVRTNAFIVFFALWSFFMVARRFMAIWGAILATLLLMINPALLWTGRGTFTEPLHIFIFFFGLYLLYKAIDVRSTRWAMIAGVVLGITVLNRLSGALGVLVIWGGVIYAVLLQTEARRLAIGLVAGYLLSSTVGFVDGYFNSYAYFYDLWQDGSLRSLIILNYITLLGAGILLKVNVSSQAKRYALRTLDKMILPVIFLLVGWFLVRYKLSYGDNVGFDLRSGRELSWYVTSIAILFSFLSLFYAKKEKNWLFILTVGFIMGATFFVYTWKPSITPDHYWASRRWISFCIPLIVLCFVKTLTVFYDFLVKKNFSSLTVIAVLGIPVYWYIANAIMLSSPFLLTSMLNSYPKGYATVSENIKKLNTHGVYLSRDKQVASYLTYMYGIPTALLTKVGVQHIRQGEIINQPALGLGLDLSEVNGVLGGDSYSFCGDYTERIRGGRPSKLVRHCRELVPGITVSPNSCRSITLGANSKYFGTRVGRKKLDEGRLISNGSAGTLQFGPYIATGAGQYRVIWRGKVLQTNGIAIGEIDAVVNKGQVVINRTQVLVDDLESNSDELAHLDFELLKPVSDLEYRFRVAQGVRVALSSIELTCIEEKN